MKKLISLIIILSLTLLFISTINTRPPVLTYTESSSGLQNFSWEGGRTELEFADMNNDGYKDLISIGDHGSPLINTLEHGIMVYFGNGTGANWNLFQYGDFGYGGIAAGDVNNDGKMDVGYGMHHNYSSNDLGNQIFEVALGDGTGMNWIAWDDSLATHGETWGMFTTDFGDIDNDGKLDVGSISFGCCAGIHIYKNLGTGVWRQTFGITTGNSLMEFHFGDMNNDGNIDFAASHQSGTPYFGDGQGNFTLMHNNLPAAGNTGLRGVSLGDVNNDGAKDLAFISNTGGAVNVWKWNNGTTQWDNLSAGLPASSTYQVTQLYDMNADGFCDLVIYGNTNCTIYTGNGGTAWTQAAYFTTPPNGSYEDITVSDVDNNGFPDIAFVNNEGSGYNTYNVLRFFKETSVPASLSLRPLFPIGGERFKNNSVKFIDWLSTDPAPVTAKVKLELSVSGNSGPWTLIRDSLPNSGRYQWIVPSSVSSENCYIRYTIFESGNTAVGMNTSPFIIGSIVGISSNNETPMKFELLQNYPNPFNPETNIGFKVSKEGYLQLNVYDLTGKLVKKIVGQILQPGSYEVIFDGSNLPSGVYYYRLEVVETPNTRGVVFTETKKMVLVK